MFFNTQVGHLKYLNYYNYVGWDIIEYQLLPRQGQHNYQLKQRGYLCMQQSEVDVFLPVHIICPSEAAIDKLTNVLID